jgi:hypothetical protein
MKIEYLECKKINVIANKAKTRQCSSLISS